MALVSNIHVGLAAWTGSGTSYTAGQRRSNGSNAYQCVTSGTGAASGGPTGTGLLIQDNTAWWTYLSSIDYTTLAAWQSSLPTSVFTQSITGQVWNDGVIAPTVTTNNDFMDISTGGTPTSTYPLVLTAAPGESFCDVIGRNPQGGTALAYSASNGVAFSYANVAGPSNGIYVEMPYVTISRIQIYDPSSSKLNTIVSNGGSNFALDSCLVDAYARNGCPIFYSTATGVRVRNCLFVDRQASGTAYDPLYTDTANTTVYANCTVVGVNNPTGAGAISNAGVAASVTVTNCAIFGYLGVDSSTNVGSIGVDHCVFSSATNGNNNTDNGGNLFSKTASNNFVAATTDFRLKSRTADCYNAGTVQSTYVPSLRDIAGTPRPQNGQWDVGCWEFLVPLVYRRNLTRLRMRHLQHADPRDLARRDWNRLADHFRDGQIAGRTWI